MKPSGHTGDHCDGRRMWTDDGEDVDDDDPMPGSPPPEGRAPTETPRDVLANQEFVLDARYIIYGDDQSGWHWSACLPGGITLHPGKLTRDEAIAACRRHAGLPPLNIYGEPIQKDQSGDQ